MGAKADASAKPSAETEAKKAAAKTSAESPPEPPAAAAADSAEKADAKADVKAGPKTTTRPSGIGWRTEFRTMEVQMTDFENAAFSAFIVLITRVLLVFDLDFLAPLSKVDENMRRAMRTDALARER